mgnify:CR=1 FL=1
MDLGNGWTTEKLRDEILEHIWIDETGDMGGVHCMHCLGYEQGEIDRAINTVFAAALRRAKAEGRQEQQALLDEAYQVMSLWFKYFNSDIRPIDEWTEVAGRVNAWLPLARDARAAQIEEGA